MNPEDSGIGSDVSGKVYLHQKSHSGFEVYPDTEFSPLDFGFVFFSHSQEVIIPDSSELECKRFQESENKCCEAETIRSGVNAA